jgi:hypothetical protein
LFVLWLVIVWGFRYTSRGFKLVLALCALAGWASSWGLKAYCERIDWTGRGLNPDRPGFKPAVVLLAGTVDFGFTSPGAGAPGNEHPPSGTARFEIRMRGTDYYYAQRWTGWRWKYGSWEDLQMSLPDFSGIMDHSYVGSGHHGGGTSSDSSNEGLLVARRLWRGEEFVRAAAADEYSLGDAKERFSELKQFGRFRIPKRIEFTERELHEILHVRRVEFLNQPDTNWFWLIKQKYFDRNQSAWSTNLNEAGWAGERKP